MSHVQEAPFPNCCTAWCLYDFGGTRVTGGTHYEPSYHDLWDDIHRHIRDNAGGYVTLAMTNSSQKVANQVLKDLGFDNSPWMTKDIHPGTKVRFWWLSPKNRRKAVRK